jgi:colanic acid/amylovoran biosynthesis glycosyltransferase
VVAHITRASPRPTEAFIHNQRANLERYRPIAVCHHRGGGDFPNGAELVAGETRSGPARVVDGFGDRVLRTPLAGTLRTMGRFIEDSGAAVLHFHFLVNARTYLALKAQTNLPAVVSAYGYDVSLFPRRGGGLGRRYLAPIFSRFECFLAMSDQMRRDLVGLGCPEDRIRIHYHGVDTRRFRCPGRTYEPRSPTLILSAGRLIPTKGHDQLIQALALVRGRCSVPFRLRVVGEGPLRRHLERELVRFGMDDVVELVGYVPYMTDRLEAHYREADVFALPLVSDRGQREGIPGALVEAMAAGLPVVSTHHGGVPAVLNHEREGLLVPEGNVGRLADALERLLVDASLRRELGAAGARRAEAELDVAPATRQLEGIYDELCHRAP